MVDLRTALQPLVDQPSAAPRPVDDIARDARHRRQRRRSVAAIACAATLVAVVGAVALQDSPDQVTTVDQSTTTSAPPPTPPTTAPSTTAATAPPPPTPSTSVPPDTAPPVTAPPAPTPSASGCAAPSAGAPGRRDFFGRIEAETYDAQQGVTRSATPGGQGCQVVAGNGDHVMFQLDSGEELATRFEAHVASGVAPGTDVVLEARLDAVDSPPFATIHVGNTGGGGSFTTVGDDTSAAIGGNHAVFVTVTSSQGGDAVNVDWFRFQP